MTAHWSFLYRGPLSSCNYACTYCPFGKTRNTRAELEEDAARLKAFVDWVLSRQEDISVFFTPWGEALIRRHYQDAFRTLSHAPNVRRVAAQTNLSCRTGWLEDCERSSTALWLTFHPTQTTRSAFIEKLRELDRIGIAHSVGIVGLRENFDQIRALRAEMNPDTYLWINAYKRTADYYSDQDIEYLSNFDPLFATNNVRHPSRGLRCRTGTEVFSVNGPGDVRRCHFVEESLRNLYDGSFAPAETSCPNTTCGCHIGYVHLPHLELYEVFGANVLERIPREPIWSVPTTSPMRARDLT